MSGKEHGIIQDADALAAKRRRDARARRARPRRLLPFQLSSPGLTTTLALAAFLLCLSALGSWWLFSLPAVHQPLSSALPAAFPPATPTPTQTLTHQEQTALLLAQADQAWQAVQLGQAVALLEEASALDPAEPMVRDRLFVAHATLGLRLAEQGRFAEALAHFDDALALRPTHAVVAQARTMAAAYRTGAAAFAVGEWVAAAESLETVFTLDVNYHDVRYLLHQAYYLQGLRDQEDGLLRRAQAEYERALAVFPNQHLAQEQLREVNYILTPPTPTPTYTPTPSPTPTNSPTPTATPPLPQKIVVTVSQQRFRVYENEVLKWDWVCSTGRPGNNTKRGAFQVLDKIPNAWGGTWGIWMPYWLGIYWAGPMENGIHALPINPDGSTLWAGYLGSPISFGCVVLDTYAARLLFDWVQVGTPVIIEN